MYCTLKLLLYLYSNTPLRKNFLLKPCRMIACGGLILQGFIF